MQHLVGAVAWYKLLSDPYSFLPLYCFFGSDNSLETLGGGFILLTLFVLPYTIRNNRKPYMNNVAHPRTSLLG